tara:strand:+ start:2670 stop:2897 length:228 start_codon:yes stop_codon:yes gene_type:complete
MQEEYLKMLNDPEFAEIIELSEKEIDNQYKLKKVMDKELKIYVSKKGKVYYEHDSVMDLVRRHDELVDKINERSK